MYLVAEEQWPADIDGAKALVAFQQDGEGYHTLSVLQGQRRGQRDEPLVKLCWCDTSEYRKHHGRPTALCVCVCVLTRSQSASSSSCRVLFTCSMLARAMAPLFPILLPESLRESKVLFDCGERERNHYDSEESEGGGRERDQGNDMQ